MTADVTTMPAGMPEAIEQDPGKRRRRRKTLVLVLLFLAFALLLGIAIWYLIFRQPIPVPLPLIPESQIPTYSTSVYGVTHPLGLAVSPSGERLYVTEGAPESVGVVLDAAGNVQATMAPPASTGTDHQPVYVAIDPVTRDVYVSDHLAGAIYVYDESGAYQRELALAEPRPGWQPMGLAFDAAGNLYVTDFSGPFQKILVIDRTGAVTRTLGETENLNYPNGLAVAEDGTVFVTDGNNGRLIMYGSTGKGVAVVGRGAGKGSLGLPRGLVIDSSARLLAVDTSAHGVFVYGIPKAIVGGAMTREVVGWFGARGGRSMSAYVTRVAVPTDAPSADSSARLEFLGSFGEPGMADGQFSYPNAVAIDSRGRVYVTDTFNNRVQIWSY